MPGVLPQASRQSQVAWPACFFPLFVIQFLTFFLCTEYFRWLDRWWLPSPATLACQVVDHYLVGVGFDSFVPYIWACLLRKKGSQEFRKRRWVL